MANTDIKISAIPQTTSLANTDIFVVVKSPNSSPTTNTVTLSSLRTLIIANTIANTTGIYAPTVSVSTNTGLTVGTSSKSANGYSYLPNGVLLQWGTVSANNTVGNATFPIAFPTACQSVTMNVIGSANVAYHAAAPNTTIAQIRTSSTTTALSVEYTAIGY